MSRTRRAGKGNAATAPKPAAGARFDAKSRILDRAILLARQGRYSEAETYLRDVLPLRPNDVEVLIELGAAVWRQRRWAEAEAIYRRAYDAKPDDFRVLNNLGLALYEQRRLDEAGDFYRRALRIQPDTFNSQMNLGIVLSDQGKFDEAMEWFLSAQQLQPNSIEILQNLAMNLTRQGRSPEAIAYYEQGLRLQPEHFETHVNLAYALLCGGDYERGWREYEWRWKSDKHPGYRINRPLWNGEDIHDRTILLHTEQGFGDNLQFIRFAPMVKKRAGLVLAACKAPLLKLIARCNGVDMAFEGGSYQPSCDVQAPLMSLPAILGITLDTLPAQVPYLITDKMLVDHWGSELAKATAATCNEDAVATDSSRLAQSAKPFRIGIAWQGNPVHSNDRWRSFRLANFAPIAELPGVRLISLQTDHGLDQLKAADRRFPVIEIPSRRCQDFMETAAIMTHLDLVITPDTALAHLAGALGLRVWAGLCTVDEWRWLAGREDTPWYPTMRLFRQTTTGDWDGVFRRMTDALQEELQKIAAGAL
jgi:Flp pilus assembly protein TadD